MPRQMQWGIEAICTRFGVPVVPRLAGRHGGLPARRPARRHLLPGAGPGGRPRGRRAPGPVRRPRVRGDRPGDAPGCSGRPTGRRPTASRTTCGCRPRSPTTGWTTGAAASRRRTPGPTGPGSAGPHGPARRSDRSALGRPGGGQGGRPAVGDVLAHADQRGERRPAVLHQRGVGVRARARPAPPARSASSPTPRMASTMAPPVRSTAGPSTGSGVCSGRTDRMRPTRPSRPWRRPFRSVGWHGRHVEVEHGGRARAVGQRPGTMLAGQVRRRCPSSPARSPRRC